MANFTAAKTGGWAFEDPVTHDQISTLQQHILKAPNFSEGSVHDTTGLILVGGSGLWHNHTTALVSTNNQTIYADLSGFLLCGLTTGSSVKLSNSRSTGGTIPNGSVVFATNNSTTNEAWLHREDDSVICKLPVQTTGPNVVPLAVVWRVSGAWGVFWASSGVLF